MYAVFPIVQSPLRQPSGLFPRNERTRNQCLIDNVDAGFEIGYNPAYDSAVMTVVSQPLQEDAWFGWNNVSGGNLPDVGPNPVYKLGTFT